MIGLTPSEKARDICGASDDGNICERARGHEGNHCSALVLFEAYGGTPFRRNRMHAWSQEK